MASAFFLSWEPARAQGAIDRREANRVIANAGRRRTASKYALMGYPPEESGF
jgi:hypothetical protein